MAANLQSKWAQEAAKLQSQHAAFRSCEAKDLTIAMGELWNLVRSAPREIRDAYAALREDRMRPVVNEMRDNIDLGRLSWQFTGDSSKDAMAIGAQMRALDAELASRPDFLQAPRPDQSFLHKQLDAYIIPRGNAKTLGRNPGPGNGIWRRGTPHHRFLPRVLDATYTIDVKWSPHFAYSVPASGVADLGAALFPQQKIDWDEQDKVVVAMNATCDDDDEMIKQHLAGAFEAPALAAVWPELSMTDTRLTSLVAGLQEMSLSGDALAGPTIIAAGSWHDKRNGKIINLMRVFDKHGEQRLEYQKISRFVGKGVEEGNQPGTVIPVLVNNDALITFAVCSDFCVIGERLPYLELDVDLILIASLGNEGAVNGHEQNAASHRTLFGSQTFLVQQHEESGDPIGWVLPRAGTPPSLNEDRAWSRRQFNLR